MDINSFLIAAFSGGRCKELADKSIHFEVNDMQVAEDTQLIVGHLCMQWLNSNKPSEDSFQLMAWRVDFMSVLHKSTQRDYLARVNDQEFPKAKAAELAKFDLDYWDGDRRICYGGYHYIEGRWIKVAKAMADYYDLPSNPKILDIGCGKGYLIA